MFSSTVQHLRCPKTLKRIQCRGRISLTAEDRKIRNDVLTGTLTCEKCNSPFPIIAGVAILVPDPHRYLLDHVHGIMDLVAITEIPSTYRKDFLKANEAALNPAFSEDLESDRVNALYLLNHFLEVNPKFQKTWWKKEDSQNSEWIEKLWHLGPTSVISGWLKDLEKESTPIETCIELGCSVGGLLQHLSPQTKYLGIDQSFRAIALARFANFQAPYAQDIQIPQDLLQGTVSKSIKAQLTQISEDRFHPDADFIVGDLLSLPVTFQTWDAVASLNVIDMLDDPEKLVKTQGDLLREGGHAIECSPYIWNPTAAKKLKKSASRPNLSSDTAVIEIYAGNGFEIVRSQDSIPWLFFKHFRQIELYNVHALLGKRLKSAHLQQ